jgi:hypothetical protein
VCFCLRSESILCRGGSVHYPLRRCQMKLVDMCRVEARALFTIGEPVPSSRRHQPLSLAAASVARRHAPSVRIPARIRLPSPLPTCLPRRSVIGRRPSSCTACLPFGPLDVGWSPGGRRREPMHGTALGVRVPMTSKPMSRNGHDLSCFFCSFP